MNKIIAKFEVSKALDSWSHTFPTNNPWSFVATIRYLQKGLLPVGGFVIHGVR